MHRPIFRFFFHDCYLRASPDTVDIITMIGLAGAAGQWDAGDLVLVLVLARGDRQFPDYHAASTIIP